MTGARLTNGVSFQTTVLTGSSFQTKIWSGRISSSSSFYNWETAVVLRVASIIYVSVGDNCSTSGCPYGEGCHFLHYVPGGIAALGLMPLGVSVTPTAPTPTSGMRTVLGGFGPTSNTPLLANSPDPGVTIGGYKTRLCNKFSTPEGCRFGEKCHFAHGESDLRPTNVRSNGVDYLVLPVWTLKTCWLIDIPLVAHCCGVAS